MFYIKLIGVVLILIQTASAGNPLQKAIQKLVKEAKAHVAVSVDYLPTGKGKAQHVGINEYDTMVTMSVIKFPIAISTLHAVEMKLLNMDQQVYFDSNELKRFTYSPILQEHQEPFYISLEKAISYAVSRSDNVATDIVLDAMKGPDATQIFLHEKGFNCMKIGTAYRHMTVEQIGLNWSTAKCMNQLLIDFYKGKLLQPEHTKWLYLEMLNSPTTSKRIKGKLPQGTAVAHKTGTYYDDTHPNYEEAINDIGLIKLPGGGTIALTVFVNESYMSADQTEELIATIAKLCYDHFNHKNHD